MTPAWLHALLSDERTTDICLNGSDTVFADRGAGLETVALAPWSENELRNWVLEQISAVGKTWDAKHPFVDAVLNSGHRVHVVFPPISRQGILVSLRRLACRKTRGPGRWRESRLFPRLSEYVARGDSVLISGATGSGKTTLASDLLEAVPSQERIIALEDTPELTPAHERFLSLNSRPPNADGFGEVSLRTLLKQALRMRPDRIVLGECRGSEVLDLLQSLNTGHRGALATLHANSPRDAIRRVELLCLLAANSGIGLSAIRELLSIGIQWVAHVARSKDRREISEIWHVEGREGDTILMRPVLSSEL